MPLPTEVQFFFTDDKAQVGIVTVRIPWDTPIADARCFAQEMSTIVDRISQAYQYSITITYHIDVNYTNVKYPAEANSDSEAGAIFVFNGEDGLPAQTRVPAFREEYLNPNSRVVDQSEPDVVDFINAMVNGLCDPIVEPVTYGGSTLDINVSAKESFARSRQGRRG